MIDAVDSADAQAVVIFHLGGQGFAFAAHHVAEVLPNAWLSRPPSLPAMAAGFLDLGGQALLVLRGDLVLGVAPQSFGLDASILVLKGADGPLGLLVGRVESVRALHHFSVQPVAAQDHFNACLTAQLALDGKSLSLLDWPRVLDRVEQDRLRDFQERMRARRALWDDTAS